MGEQIKKFLREINNENIFLFNQFYLHPETILGGEEENTIDDYYKYGKIKELLKTYQIFNFIELCLNDDNFIKNIEGKITLIRKMIKLTYDFREYHNKCKKDINQEIFKRILNENNINLNNENNTKNNWIEELELKKEKVIEIDDGFLKRILNRLWNFEEIYYNEYIIPKNIEDNFIKQLKEGKYSETLGSLDFIITPENLKESLFKALACSNKILELFDKELEINDIPYYDLEIVINLIEFSLDLYNKNFEEDSLYDWYYDIIGEKRINEYNSELAEQVLDKIYKQRTESKIIKLY